MKTLIRIILDEAGDSFTYSASIARHADSEMRYQIDEHAIDN